MKRVLFAAALGCGLIFAGWNQSNAQAEEEAEGPVPERADPANPASEVYRASSVIGMPVRNADGEEIGKIKDLVIDGRSREVLYAVLSMSGAEDRDVVYIMPWTIFEPAYARGQVLEYATLGVPQNVWNQAPTFNANQWQTVGVNSWAPQVNTYFAKYVSAGPGAAGPGANGTRLVASLFGPLA